MTSKTKARGREDTCDLCPGLRFSVSQSLPPSPPSPSSIFFSIHRSRAVPATRTPPPNPATYLLSKSDVGSSVILQ